MHHDAAPVTAKIVYWGPAGAGKTANLAHAHARAPQDRRGSLFAVAGEDGCFDYLTLDLGPIDGTATRLELYAVPAWVTSLETRRLVLTGADAVVFVADSRPARLEAVCASFAELSQALEGQPDPAPVVFQWNHRDHPQALPAATLAAGLAIGEAPAFEVVALEGAGVMACLRRATELALARRRRSGPRPSDAVLARGSRTLIVPPAPAPTRLMHLELPPPDDLRPSGRPVPPRALVRPGPAAGPPPVSGPQPVPRPQPQPSPPSTGADQGPVAEVDWCCPWSSSGDLLLARDADDPLIGARVGACRVHRKLGEGGMGAVYLGRHEALGKDFVVKVLKPGYAENPRRVERFVQEARAAARLEHPNVVAVQDVGVNEHGLHYIVMQYVEGRNLFERLRDQGALPPRDAAALTLEVARALQALHAAGLVHRDVKPENVVLTPRGEVKLIDFGLAKDLHAQLNLTAPGAMIGTPIYMAPEIGRVAAIDGRADIYSLGLTLWFLLSGRPPFEGRPLYEVIFARARLPRPEQVVPGLPPGFRRVLGKMLAWDRGERYADAAALIADLEALVAGREPVAVEPCFWLVEGCPGELPAFPPLVPDGSLDELELPHALPAAPPVALAPAAEPPPRAAREQQAQAAIAARAAAAPDRLVGRWALLEPVERRAQCRLWRAWDLEREVEVGVQLLEDLALDPQVLEPVRRLSHPGLLPLLDYGEELRGPEPPAGSAKEGAEAPRAWLVTAPLPEISLKGLYNRPGRSGPLLPPLEAARVIEDAARALAHAHEQGIAHGRLRPGSVWVDPAGRGLVVDLGLAALVAAARAASPHQARRRSGRYVAPEARVGDPAGAREDVFALGALLYLALTGNAPPEEQDPLPPSQLAPGILPDLDAITLLALSRDPLRRYSGPRELARELKRFLGGEPPRARPESAVAPALPAGAAWQRLITIAALALLMLVLLLGGPGRAASPEAAPPGAGATAGR